MASEYTTINAILYKSKTLSNGKHPIMLRVTKNRVRKYISLGISLCLKDWNSKNNLPKKNHPHKDVYDAIISKSIQEHKNKLMNFKQEGKDFTPDILIAEASNHVKKTTVFNFFEYKIRQLKDRTQIGNSKVYNDTYNQLKKFSGDKDFTFSQLDFNFLIKFESYLKANDLADNGISVRFRTIRALFNQAIAENYTKKELYPFDKFKISERYSTKTQKRAISKEDIKKVEALKFKIGSAAFEAQQYFLFSYYGQGINFVDIAHLKWGNLVNGRIFYKRAKTGNDLNFNLPQPALVIIEYWKPEQKPHRDEYIFPILNSNIHLTPLQRHNRIHKVLTRVNRDLKAIGIEVGIETPANKLCSETHFCNRIKTQRCCNGYYFRSNGTPD